MQRQVLKPGDRTKNKVWKVPGIVHFRVLHSGNYLCIEEALVEVMVPGSEENKEKYKNIWISDNAWWISVNGGDSGYYSNWGKRILWGHMCLMEE